MPANTDSAAPDGEPTATAYGERGEIGYRPHHRLDVRELQVRACLEWATV